jgi:AcrR family transcriptional regulator
MRYPPEHKESTRARLLEAGGALAKKDGFASTGVDGLMAAVGLTSGAFYSHFRSKAELLEAIVESELGRSLDSFAGKTGEQLAAVLESYLSTAHVDEPARGCAVTTLSTEVARSTMATREVFERMMIRIKDELSTHLARDGEAWIMISQMVGAVMIARAMASGKARESLLEAVLQRCREMLDSEPRHDAAQRAAN